MRSREEDYIVWNECVEAGIQEYYKTGIWRNLFLDHAIRAGRLSDIRFAIEHGCPLGDDPSDFLLNLSLCIGRVDCVLYFHQELKIPLNDKSTLSGSCNPDIQFLKYAIEHGASLHKEAMNLAIYNNLIEHIKYLLELGATITSEAFQSALSLRDGFEMAELLINNGYRLVEKNFSSIDGSYIYELPFDKPFWRQWLFENDVSQYRSLEHKKKDLLTIQRLEDEIKQLKEKV